MRIVFVLVGLILASSASTFAQKDLIELGFESNRNRYTREHFSEGEDASSGFDYIYFRNDKAIVMIRSIWSATHTRELRIEDMYFRNGGLAVFRRATAHQKSIGVLKTGRNSGLTAKEVMHFENGKLVSWTQNGSPVSKVGTFWPDAEKSTLETARQWVEYYADLKKSNK
jgi:hypothetical protein